MHWDIMHEMCKKKNLLLTKVLLQVISSQVPILSVNAKSVRILLNCMDFGINKYNSSNEIKLSNSKAAILF